MSAKVCSFGACGGICGRVFSCGGSILSTETVEEPTATSGAPVEMTKNQKKKGKEKKQKQMKEEAEAEAEGA